MTYTARHSRTAASVAMALVAGLLLALPDAAALQTGDIVTDELQASDTAGSFGGTLADGDRGGDWVAGPIGEERR